VLRPAILVAIRTLSRFSGASQVLMMDSARPLRFGLGKHRIDFGGVKDVDAAIDRILHARPRSSARRRSWCRGKLAHACAAEFAITHDAPKIGARLRGDHDEIDGAVLLDLLLGTLRREEGGEEKP